MESKFSAKAGVIVLVSHYGSVVDGYLSEIFWHEDNKEYCLTTRYRLWHHYVRNSAEE